MKKPQLLLKKISNLVSPLMVLALFVIGSTTNSVFSQNWDQIMKAVASDRGVNDFYGWSVAISGDYAIVGAPFEDQDTSGGNFIEEAGSAYILKNNAGTWSQVQKIVASDRGENDNFGYSVSISGDYAMVGAPIKDFLATGGNILYCAGSAYIFKNNAGTWSQIQKIVASDVEAYDNFGYSVAISGDYAILSSPSKAFVATGGNLIYGAGSAYIFKNNSGTWSQMQKIVASDVDTSDNFGYSVSISGNYAIVGAFYEDHGVTGENFLEDAGSAYIFKNNVGNWSQVQKIVASDRDTEDWFGQSVAISGEYIILGACLEDDDALGENYLSKAGSAYIFKNNAGTWSQVQKIVALDREYNDWFGQSVAISGDYAIVGARLEDHDAIGGNYLDGAGSSYLFQNNAGTWSQVQKIVASDRGEEDDFSYSVAISGDYVIVGANWEYEDATGGNTLINAGSSYIFKNCPATSGTDIQTACDSYTWIDNVTYTASNNTATFTLPNAAGCDSLVTLNLTINSVSDLTTSTSGLTISANFTNATYQWLDCNNNYAIIIGETGQTFTAIANGNYAVELTKNGCVDTSACVAITNVGMLENSFGDALLIYPNPNNGNFSLDLGAIYKNTQILITDIFGKLVESRSVTQSQFFELSIEEPAGIYIVSIQSDNKKAVIRLVKK